MCVYNSTQNNLCQEKKLGKDFYSFPKNYFTKFNPSAIIAITLRTLF